MPYRTAEPWTFDLTAIDLPEFVITCHDPLDLPSAYQRKVGQMFAISNRIGRQIRALGPDPDPAELDELPPWAATIIDEFIHKSIKVWTVTFPPTTEDGSPHPRAGEVIPLNEPGLDPLDPVPSYVTREIVQRLVDRLMTPPKSSGRRGLQLSNGRSSDDVPAGVS